MDKLPEGWKWYGAEYIFEDTLWCFRIPAQSTEEAKRRIKVMSETGRIYGEIDSEIPYDDEESATW